MSMRAIFEVHSEGTSASKFWLVSGQTVRVGRTIDADHTIADNYLSSLHCELECRQTECVVRDLGSRNGTAVNDTQVAEQTLASGDTIKIGNTRFVVTFEEISPDASRPENTPADSSPPASNCLSHSPAPLASAEQPEERSTEPHEVTGLAVRAKTDASASPPTKTPTIVFPEIERVILEVVGKGESVPKHWTKPGQTVHIGRSSLSDYSFPEDPRMSTEHFVLECGDRICELRDLNSSNGTFVDGERVTRVIVQNGQRVVAGTTEFELRINYALCGVAAPMSDIPCYDIARQESETLAFSLGPRPPDFVEIVRLISDLTPMYLIVAPQCLNTIPESVEMTYLCDWLPADVASRMSPIVLASKENSDLLGLIQDHWGQDQLVCVFSKCESEEVFAHLAVAARGQQGRDQVPVEAHLFGNSNPGRLGPLLTECDSGFAAFVFSKLDAALLEAADGYLLLGNERLQDNLDRIGFVRREKLGLDQN